MANELEALVIEQMLDIAPGASEEIVEADDFRTLKSSIARLQLIQESC